MSNYFPELKRPQYPSSPEILLSALAWSVIPRPASAPRNTGLIYVRKDSNKLTRPSASKFNTHPTRPVGEDLTKFSEILKKKGFVIHDGTLPEFVVEAVTDSLMGARAEKGVGYASSAIGLCGALLQDPAGGLGAPNPPNFASLLNTMYTLGGGEGSASELWFKVATHYAADPTLSRIEAALAKTTLSEFLPADWPPTTVQLHEGAQSTALPSWWHEDVIAKQIGTPFSWFRDSWDRLCSESWYTALTPRKWAAWAVCVLRNALGFSFLWEANFFAELVRGVRDSTREPSAVARSALVPTRPLIAYQRGSIAQMDVMPGIKQALIQGSAYRKALGEVLEGEGDPCRNLVDVINLLRHDHSAALREKLEVGDVSGTTNLVETVRYSLIERSASDVPDHHALLRRISRNYTHVSPGPEWIVVMAAVSASSPTQELRLGDVQRQLDSLGLKPRIDFLLAELERAGLCVSASDGDEGIQINLGIGGN